MSRLVIVSNRVADLSKPTQSGGLAVAMTDALGRRSGLWFGWDGEVVEQGTRVAPTVKTIGSTTTVTLPLTRKDYRDYYTGYSNRVLWPIFHYRLDLAEFREEYLSGYQRVNSKFADALTPLLQPDDVIWIQDYHLIPLALELRKRGFEQKIGFFLHIPFPPADILAAAPEHEWLVRAMFSYDLIGFQTEADIANFMRYVDEKLGGQTQDNRLSAFGRALVVKHCPIGIDVEAFSTMARAPEANERIELMQRRMIARTHIIGVDRLDYSKGLPDRFRAFRRLLELYPENRGAVTFMQIAPPSREDVEAYAEIREELERLTGSINGEFGNFDWTPLRYIHRNIPRDTLAALFRGSKVGLVTPLRDGMNLVAKEYIAAQNEEDPGVLILSGFAGAAAEMKQALIVNPYNGDEVAAALQKAIKMPLAERCERHEELLRHIRRNDVFHWQQKFLAALDAIEPGGAA